MGEMRVRSHVQRQGEITYIVHPRVWGAGHRDGDRAAASLLWVRRVGELHRIHATCDPRNVGSSQVLARLGMTHEGSLRRTRLIRDGWRDSLIFSVLEDEWRSAGAD
ncbi:GNAT family protein [Streptomyces sp. NPDC020766]|uniref:GNAT family N-acetyltransferase n=1 Tax=Streptomyces sp. NPDC020766 TaxID=3155011 RepID=UPI0033DAFCC8